MNRDEARALVKKQVQNRNLQKHMLAAEAVMKDLAKKYDEDETLWGLAGLLHDLDYTQTADDFEKHGFVTAELLSGYDIDERILHAIQSHPGHLPRESKMDKALYAVDPVTGLIVAATLMHPSKKIQNVDAAFLERRFGEKRFAAGADRDQIRSCETLGMTLPEFLEISLKAMQRIHVDLGL